MDALVTIVIPVFNRASTVGATLESVARQTARPLKVVLVDNGSTDATAEVLAGWKELVEAPDFKVEIVDEPRRGACVARNAGLAAVDTPWTMFFDSDDTMHPGHVGRVLEAIEDDDGLELVGWPINFISSDRRHDRLYIFRDSDMDFYNVFRSIMGTARYAARTELFRRAGGWMEGLAMADDVELGQRILALKPRAKELAGPPTVDAFETESSISTTAAGRMRRYLPAMERVKAALPEARRHWADLQIILMARTWGKDDPESAGIVDGIMAATKPSRRWLWRLLDRYTRLGLRGAARLYFPFRNII